LRYIKYEEVEEYVDECLFIDLWKYGYNPNSVKNEDMKFSKNKEINDIIIMTGDKPNVVIRRICRDYGIIDG